VSGTLEATRKGLERYLSDRWEQTVAIEGLQVASAGARRQNLLFETRRDGVPMAFCATVIPTPDMQLVEVGVEAASLRFAEAAGVPVPHVHAVCSDPAYTGGPFFITSRIEGESIPRRVLRLVGDRPGLGARLARQSGDALAKLHAALVEKAHPDLIGPGELTPSAFALNLLRLEMAELLQPSPAFRLVLRWLEENEPPAPTRVTVIHSDFRTGNIIVGPDGLRASLDWEGCRIGDPMEDLAWLCVRMWRFRNDELEVGGFASRDELRAGYSAAGGTWDAASFHWWKVKGTLAWGLGLAKQARQHLDGSFRSIVMAASGRRVAELEYDALMLIGLSYR